MLECADLGSGLKKADGPICSKLTPTWWVAETRCTKKVSNL